MGFESFLLRLSRWFAVGDSVFVAFQKQKNHGIVKPMIGVSGSRRYQKSINLYDELLTNRWTNLLGINIRLQVRFPDFLTLRDTSCGVRLLSFCYISGASCSVANDKLSGGGGVEGVEGWRFLIPERTRSVVKNFLTNFGQLCMAMYFAMRK